MALAWHGMERVGIGETVLARKRFPASTGKRKRPRRETGASKAGRETFPCQLVAAGILGKHKLNCGRNRT